MTHAWLRLDLKGGGGGGGEGGGGGWTSYISSNRRPLVLGLGARAYSIACACNNTECSSCVFFSFLAAPSTYTVPAPLKNKRHRIDSSNSVLS